MSTLEASRSPLESTLPTKSDDLRVSREEIDESSDRGLDRGSVVHLEDSSGEAWKEELDREEAIRELRESVDQVESVFDVLLVLELSLEDFLDRGLEDFEDGLSDLQRNGKKLDQLLEEELQLDELGDDFSRNHVDLPKV